MIQLAWLLATAIAAFGVGFGVMVIINARRIRRAQRELAELLDAADRAPPLRPCCRRTDPLPASLRHGRDRLIIVSRRRPR